MKNNLNLHKIIKEEHERKWVALSKDKSKVIDFDKNLLILKNKIGAQKVVFMKVPPADAFLSF
jgi:hypothetical protein